MTDDTLPTALRRYLIAAVAVAAACSSVPEPQAVWAPTTVPYDPVCSDCPELDVRDDDHHGVRISMRVNGAVDDPIAQWARCVGSFVDCTRQGSAVPGCVEQATCPEVCKQDYRERVRAEGTRADHYDAFEAVFMAAGAVCRPARQDVSGEVSL